MGKENSLNADLVIKTRVLSLVSDINCILCFHYSDIFYDASGAFVTFKDSYFLKNSRKSVF